VKKKRIISMAVIAVMVLTIPFISMGVFGDADNTGSTGSAENVADTDTADTENGTNTLNGISGSAAESGNYEDVAQEYSDMSGYAEAIADMVAGDGGSYDETLTVDTESGTVTAKDGSTTDDIDSTLRSVLSLDVDDAAAVLEDNGYTVLEVEGTSISVDDPYQTMRLIVETDADMTSSYGAAQIASYGSNYVLQFDSEADTIAAYEELSSNEDVKVYPDGIVHADVDTEDEESSEDEGITKSESNAEDESLDTDSNTEANEAENSSSEEDEDSQSDSESEGVSASSLSGVEDGTYYSWGVAVMGLDSMQEALEELDDTNDITVAVLDTGVYYKNSLLKGRVDTDNDIDYVNNDYDATDDNGHGTHCAGIIVDCTPDDVTILPIKVMDSSGSGSYLTIYLGIEYALEAGADVISMSLGGEDDGTSTYFEELFAEAESMNTIVVCAAGNDSASADNMYPAHSDYVLAVSALDSNLSIASYSNTGNCIDFAAPGSKITSTYKNTTATISGTSMATPHVAAAAASVKVWDNTLTNQELKALLEEYSVDLGTSGWDTTYGYGYIDFSDFDFEDSSANATSEKYISDATVTLSSSSYTYDGTAKKPTVTVEYDGDTLTEGTDYTVSYSNNTNAGTATVTITGTGSYTGSKTKTFSIAKATPTLTATIGSTSLTVGNTTTVKGTASTGGTITISSSDSSVVKVSKSGTKSVSATATAVGSGSAKVYVTIAATANYKAVTKYATVTVSGKNISSATVSLSSTSYTYDGTAKKPTVTVKYGSTTLTKGTDYTVSYSNNTNAGTAKVIVKGINNYSGSVTKTFTIKLSTPSVSSLTNTSSGVKVKWGKVSGASKYRVMRRTSTSGSWTTLGVTTSNTYTDKTATNGKTYYYTVQCVTSSSTKSSCTTLSSYSTSTKNKTVRLTTPTLSSVKKVSSGKMTVKWEKVSSVTGYQIQYSKSSSFSSGNKTVSVSGASKVSKTISGLTKNKKYYVRVRTYKTVSGTKYYSGWSSVKSRKL